MLPVDVLHSLIHSLSKSEKRYFRLSINLQQGDKAYLRLFNFLAEQEIVGDDFHQSLQSLFPSNTLEPARKHLYRVLMKSLRQFEAEKSVEEKLMNLIQDSVILFNRGFINASFEQLCKVKTLALEHEKFVFYILAARKELQLLTRQQFAGCDESRLIEKQEKIRELLEHELSVQQHAALYEVLLLRYWKTGVVRSLQESVRLNDLLLEEHQVLNRQGLVSFESKQLHLHFQSTYFLMTDDPQGSLRVLHELDDLFQSHVHLWSDNPDYYLHLLTDILQTLRVTEQYDKMDYFFDRLQSVSIPSESLRLTISYQVLEHRLHNAINLGRHQQALQLVNERQETLDRDLHKLPMQVQIQLRLTIARIYYKLGEYSRALVHINQILNQPTRSMSRILYITCRLMNLMLHVALENRDYVYYELRSIERKLKSEKKWFRVEEFVLKLLKYWLKNKSLSCFQAESLLLQNDPFERQLILELGLKDWFGVMIPNQPDR